VILLDIASNLKFEPSCRSPGAQRVWRRAGRRRQGGAVMAFDAASDGC
jgi:hypothetical protein